MGGYGGAGGLQPSFTVHAPLPRRWHRCAGLSPPDHPQDARQDAAHSRRDAGPPQCNRNGPSESDSARRGRGGRGILDAEFRILDAGEQTGGWRGADTTRAASDTATSLTFCAAASLSEIPNCPAARCHHPPALTQAMPCKYPVACREPHFSASACQAINRNSVILRLNYPVLNVIRTSEATQIGTYWRAVCLSWIAKWEPLISGIVPILNRLHRQAC